MSPRGAINSWQCDLCKMILVAVHVDEGVTPMFLSCRRDGCKGTMVSAGYPSAPPPQHILDRLDWEWHKASTTQMKRWRRENPAMYDHCQLGGLVLGQLTDAGRQAMAEVVA